MTCKDCGADIHQGAVSCEYCGSFVDHEKEGTNSQQDRVEELVGDLNRKKGRNRKEFSPFLAL